MIEDKRFAKPAAKECVQNVILENRKKLSVSGVSDIESFDEENIVLYTELGTLNIKGSSLHINRLSVESGDVEVEGEIDSMAYTDDDAKTKGFGIFGKLFK